MELSELEYLRELNELDLLYKIVKISQDNYGDAETVLKQRGWKASGVRLRDNMQDIKLIAEIIRDKIQIRKEASWGTKRKFALDKAIEAEKIRIEKERKSIEAKRVERLAKISENG
jgi:hypothetical protein